MTVCFVRGFWKASHWWHVRRKWCYVQTKRAIYLRKTPFQQNCKLHYILIPSYTWNLTLAMVKVYKYFNSKKHLEKLCVFVFAVKETFYWHFANHIIELFFVKKNPLSQRIRGMLWGGQWMSDWVSERVSEWEMYVCHTNLIGPTVNSQSNFMFLLQVHVTWYFYLLVSNGNLTLSFFTDKW